MKARTLVLGIGSPFISDDAIGFRVVDELSKLGLPDVDLEQASISGLDLIEMMLDYKRVIVVDAILTGNSLPGKIMILGEESLSATVHGINPHEANIGTTVALGRELEPERMPKEIVFVAVEVNDIWTVSDRMTPEVEESLPEAVRTTMALIQAESL